MKKTIKRIMLASVLPLTFGAASVQAKPSNVECIAPAGAGGGWDFTCRIPAAQMMSELDLVDGNVRVTNMSGAGGARAYGHVVARRGKDDNVIVAASTATVTRLAQNQYAGYTADNVRWVGALGSDYGVIAVRKDSKFTNIKQLMDEIKTNRRSVVVGASSAGGWDHLKVIMLAEKAGIENLKGITYASFNNGGSALLEVIAGRAVAFTGDISEVSAQLDSGDIRILALLAPERLASHPEIKTAKEQGLDVIGANWRGFYVPADISDKAYQEWVTVVKGVAQSDKWSALAEKNGLAKFEMFGSEFETFVNDQVTKINKFSTELGFTKK